jgi:phenylacetate-CoA ligase
MDSNILQLTSDINRARKQGPAGILQRQQTRFIEMVNFARSHSPYFRQLYHELPEKVDDPRQLPITNKKELMAHFNEWITDPNVTTDLVRAFTNRADQVAERFLNQYFVATSSGTTGTHGIFLMDDRAMAVNAALTSLAMRSWLRTGETLRLIAGGARMALVIATGGHFLAFAGITYMLKTNRWLNQSVQIFSAHTPMPELVEQLNRFQPAILVGYGSMLALLAYEQAAKRLHIHPVLLEPAGETLASGERERIADVFHAKVRDMYGATECQFISSGCSQGWYHINSDWVVVEPVDADYRPVQPGEPSHTVLISNLANRVQPILRYDLGDSVQLRPDPCPCGSPLPAIHVQGRAADILTFSSSSGEPVRIAPLVFATAVDRTPGVEMFQIVQTAPDSLRVRLHANVGADPEQVWQAVNAEMTHLLVAHYLNNVTIERGLEPPQQSTGGKYRMVIPFDGAAL